MIDIFKKQDLYYYLISILTVIFQFLFLAYIKDFSEFVKYIELFSSSLLFISLFGSLQFYFNKKKNIIKSINIKKNFRFFFSIFFFILISYYLLQDLIYGLFFLLSSASSFILIYQSAYYANLNLNFQNSKFIFIFTALKFFIVIFVLLISSNLLLSVIVSNLILILIWITFYLKTIVIINKGYSIKSSINTMIGASPTSIDKIISASLYPQLSAAYYLIFRVSSVVQILTEIVFRKERFQITSRDYKINKLKVLKKIIIISSLILFSSLLIKYSFNFTTILNIDFIDSFFILLSEYSVDYLIICFSFLLNSISGLLYDSMYSRYGNQKLLWCNSINLLIMIILLLNYVTDIRSLCLIFFMIQLLNIVFMGFINLVVWKKNKYEY